MTKKTTYGELKNGDVVIVQGYRFTVANIHVAGRKGEQWTMHGEPNRADVIRFTGMTTDKSLAGTPYNGGTYGAYADVPCWVVVEDAPAPLKLAGPWLGSVNGGN
jgi:hypothetical protein